MAYITTANAKRILKVTNYKKYVFEGDVYTKPINFLDKNEKKELLAIRELFSNPELFFNSYYKPLKKKRNNSNLVFADKPPAYHQKNDCERLLSDYENFQIPAAIVEQGPDTVKKFRIWFNTNYNSNLSPDVFENIMALEWGSKIKLNAINVNNSGVSQFDDLRLVDLEKEIERLIDDSEQMIRKSLILRKFKNCLFLLKNNNVITYNNTGFSDEQVREELSSYSMKINKPIKSLLIEYYRKSLDSDFDVKILEQIGFKQCKKCCRKKKAEISPKVKIKKPSGLSTTCFETYELVKNGKKIEEIMILRSLSKKTILEHLHKIAQIEGINDFLYLKPSHTTLTNVENAIKHVGNSEKLKPIYEFLNEEIDYNDIRLSLLFIDK